MTPTTSGLNVGDTSSNGSSNTTNEDLNSFYFYEVSVHVKYFIFQYNNILYKCFMGHELNSLYKLRETSLYDFTYK